MMLMYINAWIRKILFVNTVDPDQTAQILSKYENGCR